MDNFGIIILVMVFVIIFLAYKKRKENEFFENVAYIRKNFKHDSLNDSLNSIEDLEKQAQESLNSGDPEPAFLLGNTFNDADDLPKKDFRDRYGKEKGDSVRYGVATKMVKKKLNIENKDHPAKDLYEQIKGLKNKAEKSGMPYGILKKVYDRGMAAWRGGHRPGTTQQQWAFARVNSFVTKSSGTWGGADKDLAKQVKGSK